MKLKNNSYFCKKKNNMNNCSEFVRSMRRQYGLTQRQLADKSGVGLRFLRELEGGKSTMRMDKVNSVLAMFGAELGVVKLTKIDEQ
jgi:y4mF family transcriptional regulator